MKVLFASLFSKSNLLVRLFQVIYLGQGIGKTVGKTYVFYRRTGRIKCRLPTFWALSQGFKLFCWQIHCWQVNILLSDTLLERNNLTNNFLLCFFIGSGKLYFMFHGHYWTLFKSKAFLLTFKIDIIWSECEGQGKERAEIGMCFLLSFFRLCGSSFIPTGYDF